MQTNFLQNMKNSRILHGSFRQKILVAYKILQEFSYYVKDSLKIFMQIFDRVKK